MSELTDLSETDASNTTITGTDIAENCAMSGMNNAHRSTLGTVTRAYNRLTGKYASTGAADAYVLTPAVALAAYVTGERYSFRANFTNSGSSTLNISTLGAKTLKKYGASGKANLASGDIQSGQPVTAEYDGTDLVLCTPIAGGAGTTSPSYTDSITVTSTDAGATAAPLVIADRNSASPAANDVLGAVQFKGRDNGAGTDTYAQVQGEIIDPVAASEDGKLAIQTAVAGTLATRAYVAQGLVIGSATGGDQGAGTINATAIYDDGVAVPAIGSAGDVTTGTSNTVAVSPGRQHLHQSACKAWINFDGTGTPTARDSYNIASITDNGTGDYTLTFTTAMANANYCAVVTASSSTNDAIGAFASNTLVYSRTASAFRVGVFKRADGTLIDADYINVVVFGDM